MTRTQQSSQGSVLRTASATYTFSGKPATVTDANGNVTRFAYDLLDRRTSVTDPIGRTTSFAYDALSRPTATYNTAIQANPLLQQGYTANGMRAWLEDAAGATHRTSFAYDGFDRLATTTYPNSKTETWAYDADDNVTSRKTRANATLAYCYDGLNRLIRKYVPAGTGCADNSPPGQLVTYTYDPAGRLTGVGDNSAAITPVAATGTVFTTSYAYDPTNRLTGVTFDPVQTPTLPSTASTVTFTHGYNAANQRSSQSVDATTPSNWINYPPASTSATCYTANILNQYSGLRFTSALDCTGGTTSTPAYDDNGNLTDDGNLKFEYDAENRLTKSKTNAGNTIGTYVFDGRGRRKGKTVGATTTIFITDPSNRELLEYDGATGAIQRRHIYGSGPNSVLSQTNEPGGTRSTPVPGALESIVAILDASSGTLASFGYRPYGLAGAAPTQYGYTGQRIDAETGLYYYRARHYSVTWGRFLQADPIGYRAGLNLYRYALNDPLNLLDPRGLREQSGNALQDNLDPSSQDVLPPGTHTACGPPCAVAIPIGTKALEWIGAMALAKVVGDKLNELLGADAQVDTRSENRTVYHRVETPKQTPDVALLQQNTSQI